MQSHEEWLLKAKSDLKASKHLILTSFFIFIYPLIFYFYVVAKMLISIPFGMQKSL